MHSDKECFTSSRSFFWHLTSLLDVPVATPQSVSFGYNIFCRAVQDIATLMY